MKKNIDSRKGVALAEVVIALVVITIISVATLTVMFSSVQIENKTIVAMDVRNQAENAIECFRFADGDGEAFIRCLNNTTVDGERNFVNTSEKPLVYVLNKGGYSIKIRLQTKDPLTGDFVDFTNDECTLDAFWFEAAYENGDTIYRFTFPYSSNEGGITE